MPARDSSSTKSVSRVLLASSNEGKLREFQRMAAGSSVQFALLPNFRTLFGFDESAPTFAENSAGKALHYSQFSNEIVLADDSGLVVPALGGAPGVQSARYGGPHANDSDRVRKLLDEMREFAGDERRAQFVCVISLAQRGRAVAVMSDFVGGFISDEPHGEHGFGYDPVFFSPELGHTFGDAAEDEKNRISHRGKAFQKVLGLLEGSKVS